MSSCKILRRPAAGTDAPIIRRGFLLLAIFLIPLANCLMPLSTPAAAPNAQSSTGTDSDNTEPPDPSRQATNYDSPQIRFINEQIRQGWQDSEYTPSGAATDGQWCRRVYLDVLGRIPTVAELDAFVTDYSPDKKSRLVDRLLSDEYVEQYARNWTTIWTNILIGRSGGTERNSRTNRDGMQQYLRRSLQRNKPYDRMVAELISAKGTSKPGVDGFNGAVNFLAMKLDEDAVQATAQTSQIFMGVRVQCTQCHDHPFNSWGQDQFWEMNAFFRQTVALRRFGGGRNVAHIDLDNQDYQGPTSEPEEAELFYDTRNGERKAAYPAFTDADGARVELKRSGFVDDVDRRTELARLVAKSGYMPIVMVNRMWAHFMGFGFTKPYDDLGPHNPPSHPDLLDKLASDFRDGGFDIKQLIRWIVLSEAYSLSSQFGSGNKNDDPALGDPVMFSRFYPRQMRAEELYESLLIATQADKTRGSFQEQEAARRRWLQQFVIAFGTDENDETSTFNGTIPQVLMMFNGDLVKRATSTERGSFLHRVSTDSKMTPTQQIHLLFKSALAREASSEERQWATKALLDRQNVVDSLQDVWWVVLNTNEFILNH